MRHLLLFLFLAFISLPLSAFDHGHSKLAVLLEQAVITQGASSQVDYKWLQDHQKRLDAYLTLLEGVSKQEFTSWDQPQQLAYLISAYNAFTLKLILSAYPEVNSIRHLGGWFSSPWEKEFFTLLGEIKTLDAIENIWLRGKYKEPRIHFAIVCASVGCPALSNRPFLANTLEMQLEKAKMTFLGDRNKNRFDAKDNTLYLSKIFDWFEGDFITPAGSLEDFVAKGVTQDRAEQRMIRNQKVKIKYLDYDWSLNKYPSNN